MGIWYYVVMEKCFDREMLSFFDNKMKFWEEIMIWCDNEMVIMIY